MGSGGGNAARSADSGLPDRIGPYRVVGRLAKGGMAELLLGQRFGPQGFSRSVAIKRILPHLVESEAFVSMFLDEARLAAAIQHPNVVTVEDLSNDGDGLYMVMEYLAGESLAAVIRRLVSTNKTMDPRLAVHIIAEACAGLHAAHSLKNVTGEALNVVHRDISPHNLFVTYDGSVKVLDFGIAQAANRLTKTESGSIKGKFSYMSPEQVQSEALDRRTDVFALGIVFYELITLRRLFKRDNPGATLKAVLSHEIAAPSRLVPTAPADLDPICLRALSRNLDQRYPTCAAFRRDLLALPSLTPGAEDDRLPEEMLRDLMRGLFSDRADAKATMLRKMQEGLSVSVIVGGDDAFIDESGVPRVPSQSAVVTRSNPKPSRRRFLWGALGAATLVGGTALALTRPWEAEAETAPEPPPTVPAAPTTVRVTLGSEPSGARVIGPHGLETTTPGTLEVPRSEEPIEVRFELEGYEARVEEVTPDLDQRLRVQLEAIELAPPEAEEPEAPRRPRRPRRPTKMGGGFQIWD